MADIHGRFINTAVWRDDWFLSLRESEQHLFMYLLTGPASSLTGIYQLGLTEASFHTKISIPEIKTIFSERFGPDKKAFFEVGWVVMPNWLKHQRFNPNMWKAAVTEINNLPEWLRKELFDPTHTIHIPFDTVSKGSLTIRQGFDMVGGKEIEIEGEIEKEKKGKGKAGRQGGNGRPAGAGSPRVFEVPDFPDDPETQALKDEDARRRGAA